MSQNLRSISPLSHNVTLRGSSPPPLTCDVIYGYPLREGKKETMCVWNRVKFQFIIIYTTYMQGCPVNRTLSWYMNKEYLRCPIHLGSVYLLFQFLPSPQWSSCGDHKLGAYQKGKDNLNITSLSTDRMVHSVSQLPTLLEAVCYRIKWQQAFRNTS